MPNIRNIVVLMTFPIAALCSQPVFADIMLQCRLDVFRLVKTDVCSDDFGKGNNLCLMDFIIDTDRKKVSEFINMSDATRNLKELKNDKSTVIRWTKHQIIIETSFGGSEKRNAESWTVRTIDRANGTIALTSETRRNGALMDERDVIALNAEIKESNKPLPFFQGEGYFGGRSGYGKCQVKKGIL